MASPTSSSFGGADTAAEADQSEMRFRKNKVIFQSQGGARPLVQDTAKEWEDKFRKQLELSQSDAAVID